MKGFSYPGKSPLKQGSAHGQENDYEIEKAADEKRGTYITSVKEHSKQNPYWYKVNGKRVPKHVYINYKNKPGGDEPGKQTNDPDASGNKAKIARDRARNKASRRPTVLTKKQTELKEEQSKRNKE